jgi:predicted DNA binding CopG/RHH family protein
MKLTKEEADLVASIERGEWRGSRQLARAKKDLEAAARATVRKDRRVNIRMTSRDLAHFQKAAIEEGLPYQTLIASILHKYITGRLVERPRTKAI